MKRNVAVLIIILCISTTGYAQQQTSEKMSVPEYYGIYAVVNGRLLKLDEPDKLPKSAEIQLGHRAALGNILNGSPLTTSGKVKVTELPADVTFLLFYQRSELLGPMVLAEELKLWAFPYIRNVTVDAQWPNNVRRSGLENAWDSSRPTELLALPGNLLTTRIELRVKPVQGQPDMVLAVPSSKLAAGVHELSGEGFKSLLFAVSPVAEGEVKKCVDASYAYAMDISNPDSKPCAAAPATQQPAGVMPASGQGTVSSEGQPSSASAANIPAACGDYDACIHAGQSAFQSSDWLSAIADFQAVANQRPADGEAWALLGAAYLASGRNEEWVSMADKAISLGYPLAIVVCRERTLQNCERGTLSLGGKTVSFVGGGNRSVFAVPPSQVSVKGAVKYPARVLFGLQVQGKNYNFDFVPLGVTCQVELFVECPPEGMAQQLAVAKYVAKTIPKLASGAFGPPQPSKSGTSSKDTMKARKPSSIGGANRQMCCLESGGHSPASTRVRFATSFCQCAALCIRPRIL